MRPPSFHGDYGERLGDVAFWRPYIDEVVARHGLALTTPVSGFVGTYPTFLVGDAVVKLFGHFGSWARDHATELIVNRLLLDHDEIAAPRLLHDGELFGADEGQEPWPYLVFERARGKAWRDAEPRPPTNTAVACELGVAVRAVHSLPTSLLPRGDWDDDLRAGAAERHRRWGVLSPHLIDEIDAYLASGPRPSERVLQHGDITEDHVFVESGHLTALIDWGDAAVADPYLDLVPLHLGAFGGNKLLLAAFLDGYGWAADDAFADRAMSATLLFPFNSLHEHGAVVESVTDLHQLSRALWAL